MIPITYFNLLPFLVATLYILRNNQNNKPKVSIQKNNQENKYNNVFTFAASNHVDWRISFDWSIQYIPHVISHKKIRKNIPHPIKNHLAVIVDPFLTCCFLRVLGFLVLLLVLELALLVLVLVFGFALALVLGLALASVFVSETSTSFDAALRVTAFFNFFGLTGSDWPPSISNGSFATIAFHILINIVLLVIVL